MIVWARVVKMAHPGYAKILRFPRNYASSSGVKMFEILKIYTFIYIFYINFVINQGIL